MPITENNFTDTELTGAVTANPALVPVLEKALTGAGYIFRTKDANTQYETGLRETITKEVQTVDHTSTEKEITDLTGQKRDPNKETVPQFRARVIKEMKTGFDSQAAELKALQGKSDISAVERARMKELEDSVTTLNGNFDKERTEMQGKLTAAEAKSDIGLELATIRQSYIKTIPPEACKNIEQTAVSDILKEAKMIDGKLCFVNADGSIQRNQQTMLPLTAADKLLAHPVLKTIVDPGFKQTGTGTGNRPPEGGAALPDGVTDQVGLTNFLLKQGISQSSKKFQEEFTRYGGDKLPVGGGW